jgi:hypothetical protein
MPQSSNFDQNRCYIFPRTESDLPSQYIAASNQAPPPHEERIAGIRRSTFILIVLLTLVVILAAVGGVVKGSIAVQNAERYA